MLRDAEIDSLDTQVRQFRVLSGQHHQSLLEVIRKYESLLEDYRNLKSDYEEEKENREKYKRQARGQDRNPFALVLVDGDGYIFHDHLIKAGAEGGINAAQLLNVAVKDRLRKLGRDADSWHVVVRVYSNVAALSKALARVRLVGGEARAISPFTSNFSGAKDFFDIVDCGDKTFRLFSDSNQCKHVFFAGCHDTRYLHLFTPYIGRTDRITLIKAAGHQPEFQDLGLTTEDFSTVFRDNPIEGRNADAAPIKIKAAPETVAFSQQPRSQRICKHFAQKGYCKFAKKCLDLHEKPTQTTNGTIDSTTVKEYTTNWRASEDKSNAFGDDWGSAASKSRQPSFADNWGNGATTTKRNFDEDWRSQTQVSRSSFSDDRRDGSKPGEDSVSADDLGKRPKPDDGPLFADDWGTGAQNHFRTTSASRTSNTLSQPLPRSKPNLQPGKLLKSRWGSGDTPEAEQSTRPFHNERTFNSAFTTAADLPRPSPETEGLIPLNKYGDRLDYYLARPKSEDYAAFNAMAKDPGSKPCNDYQLKGHCDALNAGLDCEYNHDPLPPNLFHVLKVIVQGYPCSRQAACRRSDCYKGHVCQRPACQGRKPCKFNYQAHNLDPKVAKWVPAVDLDDQSSVASVNMAPEIKTDFHSAGTDFDNLAAMTAEWTPTPVENAEEWIPEPPELAEVETGGWEPESSTLSHTTAEWTPSKPAETEAEDAKRKPEPSAFSSKTTEWMPSKPVETETEDTEWKPSATAAEWSPAAPAAADWNPSVVEWKPSAVSDDGDIPDDEIFGDNATRNENADAFGSTV